MHPLGGIQPSRIQVLPVFPLSAAHPVQAEADKVQSEQSGAAASYRSAQTCQD